MPDYKKYVPFILIWEGGLVNDVDDNGGLTNKGITYNTYSSLCSRVYHCEPTRVHFESLTNDEVGLIVKWYWDGATRQNSINSQMIAETITGWYWGSGMLGLKWFQQMLRDEFKKDLVCDGVIGDISIKAINIIDETELFKAALMTRKQRFITIAENDKTQKKFLQGWINRLDSFASRWGFGL